MDIADSAELVTLDRVPQEFVANRGEMTVTLGGATRYGELIQSGPGE